MDRAEDSPPFSLNEYDRFFTAEGPENSEFHRENLISVLFVFSVVNPLPHSLLIRSTGALQERTTKRINLNGMLIDLAIGTSTDAVVIARGIGRPDEQEQQWIDRFNQNGFTVAMPYYSGTWGSTGNFLIDSAKDDLRAVADLLQTGEFDHEGEKLKWKIGGITFIGLSFGGLASLVAGAQIDSVNQTIAIGTPIDSIPYSEGYRGRDPIKQAIFILKSGYGGRYFGFTAKGGNKL